MGSMKTIPFFILFALFFTSSFAAERKPLPKDTKTKVVKALDLNDDLHMAFFNYDGKKIESLAQTLKEQLKKVKNEEIKKVFEEAMATLTQLSAKATREENNENFFKVSRAFVYIVNRYDVGEGYNEYTCPMVKKKWVQNSKKRARVHNPYAPEMPHCGGQVTEY